MKLLIFLTFVLGILSGVSFAEQTDQILNRENSFLRNVPGKVRFVFEREVPQIREIIKEIDTEGVFDHGEKPRTLSDADVVIYFVTRWTDVLELTGAEIFPDQFQEYAKNSQSTDLAGFQAELGEGARSYMVLIYNVSQVGRCGPKNVAISILGLVYKGFEGGSEPILKDC